MLAYYLYPFEVGQKAREYQKEELTDPQKVKELFDYCQILEGYITKKGWEFLIEHYGYEKLYEIDKKSGWHSDESENDLEDYIETIRSEIETASET